MERKYNIKIRLLSIEGKGVIGVGYGNTIKRYGKINFNDYDTSYNFNISSEDEVQVILNKIYSIFQLEPNEVLNNIFSIFNLDSIPSDYNGRSLAAGDIIEINDICYFIDLAGFRKLVL